MMALLPDDQKHALQIQAGTTGRIRGHKFEFQLADLINATAIRIPLMPQPPNVFYGDPSEALIKKCLVLIGWEDYEKVEAIALGALATAENGKKWLEIHGIKVKACKSDVLIVFNKGQEIHTIGVSVKQCNNKTPTNAQLYFTTATAFLNLLERNGIMTTEKALLALRQFCGDEGFRPIDDLPHNDSRNIDPRRFFWEEIDGVGRAELEHIFTVHQNKITRLLLQKAYLDDPFSPELLIHKTRSMPQEEQEYALYSIDELVKLSRSYSGFHKKLYSVKKGRYKDPAGVQHQAPRFGIIQMQRGGQKQHPSQLQFNLQAGYFYKI